MRGTLFMEYWNNRHTERTPQASSEYNKGRHKYLHSLINRKGGIALKLDLWNEGGRKGIFDIGFFKTFDVIGMDIAEVACAKAKKENPWMTLFNGIVELLPFKDKSIDVILDISTSDHVPFDAYCKLIRDYSRVLNEKGELLMIFNNRLPGTLRMTDVADYWFTEEEVRDIVSEYFNIELIKPYGTGSNRLKHYLLKANKR